MTIAELYNRTKSELESGGVEDFRFESEQLLLGVGIDKTMLISEPERAVSEDISSEINAKLLRRLSGEPLQYILGEWEFYGLPFYVGEGVLIPRADTETLVETALRFLKERDARLRRTLDLCAGSGCVGIALAKTASADVTFVEKSPAAFEYLKKNTALNSVSAKLILGDILEEQTVAGEYDLIVSNPPYLTAEDMSALQKEVRFEPQAALFGGADGLDFYRMMIPMYSQRLKIGGMLAVEIGMGQENAVCGIFRENGFTPRTECDLGGVVRVVYSVKHIN